MTDSDDLTAPMRPSALHAEPPQFTDDEAERYADAITKSPYEPGHPGLWRLAWTFVRRVARCKRAEKRVEALKLSAEDIETITSATASRSFAERYPHTTEALVRLLTSQRED